MNHSGIVCQVGQVFNRLVSFEMGRFETDPTDLGNFPRSGFHRLGRAFFATGQCDCVTRRFANLALTLSPAEEHAEVHQRGRRE